MTSLPQFSLELNDNLKDYLSRASMAKLMEAIAQYPDLFKVNGRVVSSRNWCRRMVKRGYGPEIPNAIKLSDDLYKAIKKFVNDLEVNDEQEL